MKKYINLSLAGVLMLFMTGCKKFIDVNTNLNSATSTKSQFVFSGALGTSYRNQVGTNLMIIPGNWVGFYAHSTSFTGGGNEKQYTFTEADFNAFDAIYDNLADYQYVKDHAAADGVKQWVAPADIMQCYMFQDLVDLYGSVPYSQAFKGIANLAPTYDNDKTIYEDLVKRLDTSMANIAAATWPTATDVTAQDVYFQGNKDKWIRFANTLKLRILMRQSFMPGRDSYITTNINNTLSRGFLLENVLVSPGYQNVSGKLNPFFANFGYNEINAVQSNYQYRKMNAVIINFLKATSDTLRLQSLAAPRGTTPDSISNFFQYYVGVPLGAASAFNTGLVSPIGPFQIKQGQGTRPGIMMTLAEALELQAEAAFRYGIAFAGGTAKQLYESGVIAHFRLCAATLQNAVTAIPGSAATAVADPIAQRYLARSVVIPGFAAGVNSFDINWDNSPDKLRSILVQNWVAYCHVNALAAWSEYRKSYVSPSPSVPYSVRTTSLTSNPEPVRYLYPQTERFSNGNNIPNVNKFTSKIFWDVN